MLTDNLPLIIPTTLTDYGTYRMEDDTVLISNTCPKHLKQSVLYHELIHATGSKERTKRFEKLFNKYRQKEAIAIEEVLADCGAMVISQALTGTFFNFKESLFPHTLELNDIRSRKLPWGEVVKASQYFIKKNIDKEQQEVREYVNSLIQTENKYV
jgi:antirestriction protein ArdC